MKARKELYPAMIAARRENKRSYLQGAVLVVEGDEFTVDTVPTQYLSSTKSNDKKVLFFGKASVFSNFHSAEFTKDNQSYSCCEQYIQSKKAELFSDDTTAHKIILTSDLVVMKRLGKHTKGLDDKKMESCM